LSFFRLLQGRCHGNQLKSKNQRFSQTDLLCRTTIRKGLQYHNSYFKRLNRMNFSTLCTIFVAFGPETLEFTLLTIAPFAAIRQKSAYHAKYLRISWIYLDLLYRFSRRISGMIIHIFVWLSSNGRCYGNQLNLGDVRRRRFGVRQWIGRFVNLLSKGS